MIDLRLIYQKEKNRVIYGHFLWHFWWTDANSYRDYVNNFRGNSKKAIQFGLQSEIEETKINAAIAEILPELMTRRDRKSILIYNGSSTEITVRLDKRSRKDQPEKWLEGPTEAQILQR